jgi:hypothetical protein
MGPRRDRPNFDREVRQTESLENIPTELRKIARYCRFDRHNAAHFAAADTPHVQVKNR